MAPVVSVDLPRDLDMLAGAFPPEAQATTATRTPTGTSPPPVMLHPQATTATRAPTGTSPPLGDVSPKGDDGYSNTNGDESTGGDGSPKGDDGYSSTNGDESTTGDVSPKGDDGYSNTNGDESTAGDGSAKGDDGYSSTNGDESTTGDVSPKGDDGYSNTTGDESTAGDGSPKGDDGYSSTNGDESTTGDVSPKGSPCGDQTEFRLQKEQLKEPQGTPVVHQTAGLTKEQLKEPQGTPVVHQTAGLTKANHEGRRPSPVQAAIRFAIAASGNQHVGPATSSATQAEMLVPAVTAVLGHLVAMGCRKQRVSIFHSAGVPQVSLADYLRRIAMHYPCSEQGLVLGLIYVDRMMGKHPELVVSGLSIHRLIATAMTLSSKFLNDISYKNEHYAKVAGLQAKELSFLEGHFLKLMDWRLNVEAEEFDAYHQNIMAAYPRGLIAQGPAAPQVKME